jgi:phage nucleotide-binding protein
MEITNTKDTRAHNVSYLIYGASKTGKTRLVTTLPSNETLLINTENNLSSIYGADVNKVDCYNYEQATKILEFLEGTDAKPRWVVLDSITDLARRILQDELAATKDGRQAYGKLNEKIPALINRFKQLPINFVAIAQQGQIKDETTGGMLFGATMAGKQLEQMLPYMFDSVAVTRKVSFEDKIQHVLQCIGCNQYTAGVRTNFKTGSDIQLYELPDLNILHSKILNIKEGE